MEILLRITGGLGVIITIIAALWYFIGDDDNAKPLIKFGIILWIPSVIILILIKDYL